MDIARIESGGHGDDSVAGNVSGSVTYDEAPDTFVFADCFGNDTATDFEINWDALWLVGVSDGDVSVATQGSDVLITVDTGPDGQSILVKGVAAEFDRDVDIVYVDGTVDDVIGGF